MKFMKSENDETTKNVEKKDREFVEADFGFSESGKYSKVYFVKPRLKDDITFEISWTEGDRKYVTKSKKIEGRPLKIENSSYVYENDTVETMKIHLEWHDKAGNPVLFILGSSYTFVLRNLLNSLINYDAPIEKLSLNLYEKEGYASLFTLIDGKKATWKYSPEEQSEFVEEIVHPKTKKLIQKDYTALNEKLRDELFEMINTIIPEHRVIVEDEKPAPDKSDDDEPEEEVAEVPKKKDKLKTSVKKPIMPVTKGEAAVEASEFFKIDDDD